MQPSHHGPGEGSTVRLQCHYICNEIFYEPLMSTLTPWIDGVSVFPMKLCQASSHCWLRLTEERRVIENISHSYTHLHNNIFSLTSLMIIMMTDIAKLKCVSRFARMLLRIFLSIARNIFAASHFRNVSRCLTDDSA